MQDKIVIERPRRLEHYNWRLQSALFLLGCIGLVAGPSIAEMLTVKRTYAVAVSVMLIVQFGLMRWKTTGK